MPNESKDLPIPDVINDPPEDIAQTHVPDGEDEEIEQHVGEVDEDYQHLEENVRPHRIRSKPSWTKDYEM